MKKSSFVEGTIISTLGIILVKILGMLYVIPFYAMVGSKGSALYAYAYNIYVIFLDVSTAGLPIAISKIINEYETLGMQEAKQRTYSLGKSILGIIALVVFVVLFLFAKPIASLLLGDLDGGNTIADVTMAIRCVSLAILVVPFLSVAKGYLQGHKIYGIPSASQVIEQVVRVSFILVGCYILLRIIGTSTTTAICLAVTGAFFGALAAYLYILIKMKKLKKELSIKKFEVKDEVSNKDIIKKMFSYAIPFIIINTIYSIYNFTDMVLISRTMNYLNFTATDVEFITTSITTWSGKIAMIVTSIAMGMTVSLIPTIVSAFTLKNFKEVNNKFNQAIQMLLMISLPMTVGLFLLARPVWSIFYGDSIMGSRILSLVLFVNLFGNIYMICSSTLQSLNKFKLVYFCSTLGLFLNAVLDIPFMVLFSKIGIPAYLGASTASICGYSISSLWAMLSLKKEHNLHYRETVKLFMKLIIPLVCMSLIVLLFKWLIPINYGSKLSCIIVVAVCSIAGALVYGGFLIMTGTMKEVLGSNLYKNIMNKVTFGLYSKIKNK